MGIFGKERHLRHRVIRLFGMKVFSYPVRHARRIVAPEGNEVSNVPPHCEVVICGTGNKVVFREPVDEMFCGGGYIGTPNSSARDSVICPKVSISSDTVVGDHVIVNNGTSINHDNRIGSGATICPGCHLAGRVTIGERVTLGVGTLVIVDIVLGSDLFDGARSVVTRSFESGKIVGSPARRYG